jgi:glycosyltransferase involved in cell wall biosynthesis
VTTDATGAVDSVVDGETGIIVKAGDSSALAAALGELVQNETMRIEMGKNALSYVQKHFARRHIWELLRGYYES